MKVLVFTTDMVPIAGHPTSGTALRTYGLISGLRCHGHEVIVSPPKNAVAGFMKSFDLASATQTVRNEVEHFNLYAFDSFNQADIVAQISPDIILCGHWPAMMLQTKPSAPVVVDLAGPHLLERHFQGESDHKGATLAKLRVMATADYFIVSGPRQRLYFLSFLLRAGVRDAVQRIRMIRMPLNPDIPHRTSIDTDYPGFVFGGVFLPWQDPSWGLEQVTAEIEKRKAGRLTLIGGKHPNYTIAQGKYDALFSKLENNPFVSRHPMLNFDDFASHLGKAHAAVDLMDWNLERQLAVTIRTTTYLWAGVPVIYNNYADLGDLIKEYDAGWCVAPGDTKQMAEILREIFEDPQLVATKAANAQLLAKTEFAWDTAVAPLVSLIEKPESSPVRETDVIIDRMESADYSIFGTTQLLQHFVCRADGLTRLEYRIATHNRRINQPLTVRLLERNVASFRPSFDEIDKANAQCIVEKQIDTPALVNNEWVGVDFPLIPHSAGKVFTLEVSSPNAALDSAISPWAMKASPYPMLAMTYNNNLVPYMSLCMRSVCVGHVTNK